MNYRHPSGRRCLFGATIAFTLATGLLAQTTPATVGAAQNQEVLSLPEFNVTSSASNNYTATDTTAGSRMDTKVKDLPYAVNSLTSQFIQDLSLFDLNEDLSYLSSVSGMDDSGADTIRGFTGSNTYLRNGHQRLGLIDVSSLDRIELIKGPSGSIYGQTNPGGALLISTKGPSTTPHQSASFSYGSYNTNLVQMHFTGPIPTGQAKHTLFFILNTQYLHRHYDEPAQARLVKAVDAELLWKPSADTDLSVDINHQSFKNSNELTLPYLVHTGNNPITGAPGTKLYDSFGWQFRRGYYTAPADWKWRQTSGYTVTLEHRFTSWLAATASYDWYHNPIETFDMLRSSGEYNTGTQRIARSSTTAVNWATIYGTGYSYSGTLLAHYHIGTTSQQTLFTVDDYLNNRRDYAKTNHAAAASVAYLATPINPLDQATVIAPAAPFANFTSSTTRNNAVDAKGIGLTHQADLFHNRLLVYAGYRHDYVTGYQLNPASLPGPFNHESHIHDSNDAIKGGFSYKLTDDDSRFPLSWYGSRIESFIPFNTSVALPTATSAPASVSPASETGVSYETGLKAALLHQKLNFTLDYFDTHRQNVGVTELSDRNDPSSPTVTINEGDQKSKGFEFDAEYLGERFHAYLSYSYVDSKVSNQGINVIANGHRPRATPYNSVGSAIGYELKPGLSVLVSMRYQGNTPEESPTTGLIAAPGSKLNTASDGRLNIRTPAYAVWNVGVVYRWKSEWEGLSQSLNFTLKNMFNKQYIVVGNNRYVGDARGLYVTYSIQH